MGNAPSARLPLPGDHFEGRCLACGHSKASYATDAAEVAARARQLSALLQGADEAAAAKLRRAAAAAPDPLLVRCGCASRNGAARDATRARLAAAGVDGAEAVGSGTCGCARTFTLADVAAAAAAKK